MVETNNWITLSEFFNMLLIRMAGSFFPFFNIYFLEYVISGSEWLVERLKKYIFFIATYEFLKCPATCY